MKSRQRKSNFRAIIPAFVLFMSALISQNGFTQDNANDIFDVRPEMFSEVETSNGDKNGDFTYSVEQKAGGIAIVHFLPGQTASQVSLSFQINSKKKSKVDMTKSGKEWITSIGSLKSKDQIEFSFSYKIKGKSYQSKKYRTVYTGPTPVPTPTPTPPSTPTPQPPVPTPTPTPTPTTTPPSSGSFKRIITIVLENTDYTQAMKEPYLKALSTQGVLFSNLSAITHPSQPNYLAMVGGSTFSVTDDANHDVNATSIADLLEAKSLNWKGYGQGYPGNCFLGSKYGRYVRKHMPFASFVSIQSKPARCARMVPDTQFQSDWNNRTLPEYSFYVPDLDNDGHDTGVAYAAAWLKGFLDPLMADQQGMEGTLILVTFDEDDGGGGNRIYTVMIGPMLKAGTVISTSYNLYDILKLVEDNFRLGNLGRSDKTAKTITGIWAAPLADESDSK